ncbi:MAG: IS1634 family transposase [Candidatus Methylomirabilales bacterium]
MSGLVSQEAVKAKRPTRGRPRKGESPPLRQVWRVHLQAQELAEVIAIEGRRARRFVLATNVLDPQQLSDAGVLQAYKGQPAVELSFKWAKNPAAIAPLFLKKPSRIAALGCLYLIALMVYTLIERQVRQRLAETGETLPDRPKPTQRPTARTVFRLMRGIAVVTLARGGQSYRHVTTLGSYQLQVIRLLGFDRAIYGHLRENPG